MYVSSTGFFSSALPKAIESQARVEKPPFLKKWYPFCGVGLYMVLPSQKKRSFNFCRDNPCKWLLPYWTRGLFLFWCSIRLLIYWDCWNLTSISVLVISALCKFSLLIKKSLCCLFSKRLLVSLFQMRRPSQSSFLVYCGRTLIL